MPCSLGPERNKESQGGCDQNVFVVLRKEAASRGEDGECWVMAPMRVCGGARQWTGLVSGLGSSVGCLWQWAAYGLSVGSRDVSWKMMPEDG